MNFNNIRHILVPVDFSEASLNALDTALAIARRHAAAVHILHVTDTTFDFTLAGDGYNTSQNYLDNSTDILQALAATIQQKHQLMPQVLSEEGYVCACIVKNGIHVQADLIVMGTHGASGFRDGFIGSNTYSVIKHASCPVLTVPPRTIL
jgi:nucleotide-binding universal stress UspA family protein